MRYIITNDNIWLSIVKIMNEIITDINALKDETSLNLKSSKAHNTIRAYNSDFRDFELFCIQNSLKSLPTKPEIISSHLLLDGNICGNSDFSSEFLSKSKNNAFGKC